eukprot:10590421-Ditylum_brightwellii.AAC.1
MQQSAKKCLWQHQQGDMVSWQHSPWCCCNTVRIFPGCSQEKGHWHRKPQVQVVGGHGGSDGATKG